MATGSSHVLSRALPGPVERVALFLVQESQHEPVPAIAMAARLLPDERLPHRARQEIRRVKHLTATPQEREHLANYLQARRVLAEGLLLSLAGNDVRDGAVLSAHALCESRQAVRPVGLTIGGGRASLAQIKSARTRLQQEISELDEVIEAAVEAPGVDEVLSRDDRTAKANPRVVHLQNRLNSLGYRVQPDGIFGPVTEENVKDLQGKAGLDVTGTVDAATRDVLRNGGKPSWQVNAPPGLVPGQSQPPPQTPPAADEKDVDKETDNDGASQDAAPTKTPGRAQGESESDGGTGQDKRKSQRKVRVSVDLGEASMERLQERLEEARQGRAEAIKLGSGMKIRVADAKIKALQEAVLSSKDRDDLDDSDFALPGRRYPIPDREHAANALARVKQNGTPDEQKKVRAAVKRKYPDMPSAQEGFVENVRVHDRALSEADVKADYAQMQMGHSCPICGAAVRDGVCQRGHSQRKLAEATVEQLDKEGLLG